MKINIKDLTLKTVLTAFFLALCYLLPFLTGQIPQIGAMLLPMHLPVLICGFLLGPARGAAVGIIAPVTRSLIFSAPVMTTAIPMAFELGVYGLAAGLMFRIFANRKISTILNAYVTLIISMTLGRIAGGIVTFIIISARGGSYGMGQFIQSYFIVSALGALLQLIIVPAVVVLLSKVPLVKKLRQ